jgi:arginase
MDLAIITGRGPDIVTDIDGLKPLMRDEDVVAFGFRDAEQQREYGSQDIQATGIHTFDLDKVRALGVRAAAEQAVRELQRSSLDGLWLHLDVDVLDDEIMPAVDYHLVGGLQWDELSKLLKTIIASEEAVGMNIGIFNPRLDKDGSIARQLVKTLIKGLAP